MNLQIDHQTFVTDCRPETLQEIRRRLTFPNPAYQENQRRGYSNWETDPLIECCHSIPGGLSFPRGFSGQACRIAKQNEERLHLDDRRRVLPEVAFSFTGTLKAFQQAAVNDVLKKGFGTLNAATGSGKTVMALFVIAARNQPVLIVVQTRELADQWRDRIESFLGIPQAEIGIIGAGKMRIGNRITVALVQSLAKHVDDVFPYIGFLIIDECHRAPSKTFTDVVTRFDCKYMLGLSATPYRRDGLTRMIHFHLGDEAHKVDGQVLVDDSHICRAQVQVIETNYRTNFDPTNEYSRMLSELCADTERNELVASHAAHEANVGGGITLILSDRKGHCEALQAALSVKNIASDVLTGDLSAKKRTALTGRLHAGECKMLIGTAQLLSEGFDCPKISSILLASPMKWEGRIIQSIGRALRPSPGKSQARIVDFCDINISVLASGARSRLRTFRQMPGVELLDGKG